MTDTTDAIKIKVKHLEFEIAPPFTNRELHVIKQVSGVRAGELWDALSAGDMSLLVAVAHLAVKRAGAPRPTLDDLWDLNAGEISVVMPEEDEPDPTEAPSGADDALAPEAGSPATTP